MNLTGLQNLKISNLSKRERIIALILLLMLLVSLYFRLVFEPRWTEINNLKVEIQQRQQVLEDRLSQGWDDIPGVTASSRDIRNRINQIHLQMPVIADEPGLLVDFYRIAKANKITSETIKFEHLRPVPDRGYSILGVSMEAAGRNSDIYRFIGDIEQHSRLNRISAVEFEPQGAGVSICKLTVDIYVLHDVEQDPLMYSFMSGDYGKLKPYEIFNYYQPREDNPSFVVTDPWLPIPK